MPHLTMRLAAVALAVLCVSGAARADEQLGPDENILVVTSPNITAHCQLSNDVGSWNAFATPQHVSIMKSTGPTEVVCRSSNGLYAGRVTLHPHADGWSVLTLPYSLLKDGSAVLNGETGGSIGNTYVAYNSPVVVPMTTQYDRIAEAKPVPMPQALVAAPAATADSSARVVHHHHYRHQSAEAAQEAAHAGS